MLSYPFFVNALCGVLLIAAAASMIGTYIMARRLVSISGGVTHACFGGLGLGCYLGVNPVLTAGLFAIASTAGVEWLAQRHRVREDSAIAVIWSAGMAAGVLFVFMTPGYVPELNSFLFGNILGITRGDLWAFGVMTAVTALFFATCFRRIVACAFDREFAMVRGLPVRFISYTMTVLVAVCIVLTIRLVGVMLLMSVLTLPQMTAEVYARRFGGIMAGSMAVSAACSVAGLLTASVIDVPCSALIVAMMVTVYAAARLVRAVQLKSGGNVTA